MRCWPKSLTFGASQRQPAQVRRLPPPRRRGENLHALPVSHDVTATERCICGRAKEVVLVGGACVNGASIQMCPDITQRLRLPWGCRCGDTFANKNYYCLPPTQLYRTCTLNCNLNLLATAVLAGRSLPRQRGRGCGGRAPAKKIWVILALK